ncbi:MAG: TonB-dependent receptor [Bacteroidota bacterium]
MQCNYYDISKGWRLWVLLVCLFPLSLSAQKQGKVTLNGYISNGNTGEKLIGATVYAPELKAGTYTNEYGFYSLTVPPGTYQLFLAYTGFTDLRREIVLEKDTILNLELFSEDVQVEEVIISAEAANDNVSNVEMSTIKLNIADVKKMPQLLGEVDIIRSIQLLPGVSTVGEGATGFNVRGGNVDQNLVLLDEAPVYNSSHLLGFFSIFNADAVNDIKLYKGGIPAKYGGRLSSVLDVRQKEGNNKKFSGTGGIGLLSSRLTLEGPIKKDKHSFMVAGRRTYLDIFLGLSPDEEISSNVLYFYDLNAKMNFTLGDKDRLFLSGYFGNDVFGFQDDFRFSWGNETATIRWNHIFNERTFSNFTAYFSDYEYNLGGEDGANSFDWNSGIRNYSVKADFGFFVNPQNTLEFGASSIFYRFRPGDVSFAEENGFNDFVIDKEHAVESAAYISNETKLFDNKITIQAGLRYSVFQNVGKSTVFQYAEGMPLDTANIVDTLRFADGELVKSFDGFEPRLSVNFLIDQKQSVKASYNRTRQYIHLISNTTAATPIDVWKPSGTYVDPATVDQFSLGYFRNFQDNTYEASLEVYYKTFDNLVDYVDGAQLLFNRTLETELLAGEGRAYGLELLLRKEKGRLTGWIGYTLSKTERLIEGINSGDWFPSNYDKTHDLSVVLAYELSKYWDISFNFAYQTGRPITYPNGKFITDGIIAPIYNNRNGARTPDYHRMDVSANYEFKKNADKNFKQSLNFSIYNLYARRNPYSIYFRQNEDNPEITEAVQLSIFANLIPSITYNFEF